MRGTYGLKYRCYGRVYGVERCGSTAIWFAVGHGGRGRHVLDKLGGAESADAMQHKLDAWARRQGLRPVTVADVECVQPSLAI